jgi:hypothetical protein
MHNFVITTHSPVDGDDGVEPLSHRIQGAVLWKLHIEKARVCVQQHLVRIISALAWLQEHTDAGLRSKASIVAGKPLLGISEFNLKTSVCVCACVCVCVKIFGAFIG